MPYCKRCGSEVLEDMTFCSRCGAALKVEEPHAPPPYRAEKTEKREKTEFEKREFGVIGPLVGGLVLIFLGVVLTLERYGFLRWRDIWPYLLIMVGVVIVVVVVFASVEARRRHPKP